MKNFDPKFRDFPDYILKITEEIWEGRKLTTLYDYYAPDVIMRMPSGIVRGNEAVIDGTLATIAEFPDRELLGEDVIWSGDDEAGYLSSHRIVSSGTHTGYGIYGPPTGKRMTIRAIADCAAKSNAIYDEWLVRDGSGLLLQLGLDPVDFVRRQIASEGGSERANRPFSPDNDIKGRYAARGNDNEWGNKLADLLTTIMNKDLSVIAKTYDRAVRSEHPGLRGGWGRSFAETEWMRLRCAFPSSHFEVHHVIGREDPNQPPRAAVRWSMTGRHEGTGAFGPPTGAMVHVMGITHAEWGPWGLRREFTLFDETAIWKQILIDAGDA
ncbi:ester cyclase [Mesorhizobium sp. INR15]|uniref:nuclear transport factor 2 family protein n=1 Tax=Mesorhizobium sp. INR15 TaxID=2654248 RepID=UPI001896959D|nr:ester cyclase [Mesorhizobium sp. INR15]QPC95515.1 nuclear transport factor 2 family protein [Mesorhizobium sp. INR15]